MKKNFLYICFLVFYFSSCIETPEMTDGEINGRWKPIARTINNTATTVVPMDGCIQLEGKIEYFGKRNKILNKGFYYSFSNPTPTEKDSIVYDNDTKSEEISSLISNVSGGKTIYWRAFVENEYGIDIANAISYSTPPVWEIKDEFGAQARGYVASFKLKNKFFIVGGEKEGGRTISDEGWSYSIDNDRWREIANLPGNGGQKRRYAVSFVIDDYAYVGTGQYETRDSIFSNFFQYNIENDSWREISVDKNFERRFRASAFQLKGKGYIVGGENTNPLASKLKDVWCYSPNEFNPWKRLNDLPEEDFTSFYNGISISDGEQAFIGFGYTSETKRSLWKYNDLEDSWIKITEQPEESNNDITAGALLNNTLFLVDKINQIWEIDLNTLIWKKKTKVPFELKEGGQVIYTHNNSIYIGLNFCEYFYQYRPLWDNDEYVPEEDDDL